MPQRPGDGELLERARRVHHQNDRFRTMIRWPEMHALQDHHALATHETIGFCEFSCLLVHNGDRQDVYVE